MKTIEMASELPPMPENAWEGKDILVLSPTPTYPLDAGNRKRIYHYCREFQARGARIHFIYYPFEWYFTCIPQNYLEQMAAQWESFHLLPVTMPLQAPPKDGRTHHDIDEWWDWQAIEPTLKWLFQRGKYDAFVVNYPYLSKAFEFAPKGTLRILDMHDKFTGRRELLEGMGVSPEYFYLTAPQEKAALDRADLIWAIKEEEAEFFRTITDKPVITMPHIEPECLIERRRSPEDEDYIVLGMVGARNTVNFRNAMSFINEVLPILSRFLAPIKIRFGGSMCADLEELEELPDGVELHGRFDKPEEFYSQVDAVLVPLTFSTGLKIKAVEAFAMGMPIIAHKHAVEGIPVTHPFHRCSSPEEIAKCCIQLAANPGLLDELRVATSDTYRKLNKLAQKAFSYTTSKIVKKNALIFAIAPEFLESDSIYRAHVYETFNYLRWLGPVTFYIDRPLPGGFQRWAERLNWLAGEVKAVISPPAAQAMGLTENRKSSQSFPIFYTISTFKDYCTTQKSACLWLLDLPSEMLEGSLQPEEAPKGYLRLDAIRQLGYSNDEALLSIASKYPHITLVSNVSSASEPLISHNIHGEHLQVPYWYWGNLAHMLPKEKNNAIWIASTPENLGLAICYWRMCKSLSSELTPPKILLPKKADCEAAKSIVDQQIRTESCLTSYHDLLSDTDLLSVLPNLVLDVSSDPTTFSILEETATRQGVQWLRLYQGTEGGALVQSAQGEPQTLEELFNVLAGIEDLSIADMVNQGSVAYQNDAGWLHVWSRISAVNSLS